MAPRATLILVNRVNALYRAAFMWRFSFWVVISLGAVANVLAYDWQGSNGFRSAALAPPGDRGPGFTRLAESVTGIRFTNHLSDRSIAENQIRLIGSGLALGDVDGDGRADIYVCRLEGGNVLYRNLGQWRFEDRTAHAGVACAEQYSTGAALVDLDGDGDLDLLVNGIGVGTRCFFNDGTGRFTERNSGLQRTYGATSMALADIDGNGTLDLYVANYRTTTIRSTGLQVLNVNGRRMLRPEDRDSYELTPEGMILEHAEPDALYLNDGKGNFSAMSWTNGAFLDAEEKPLLRADKDWGLSVLLRDLNGDGAPDIYVCNDFWSADAIWINDGRGRFRALPKLAMRNSSTFSMGVDVADINRDGFDDFFVLDMRSREHGRRMTQRAMLAGVPAISPIEDRPQTERNTLYLNRGDHTYAEIAQLAGVQASEWSWATVFVDVDLDGYEDVLITTGHAYDSQDADAEAGTARLPGNLKTGERILHFPRLAVPNQAFRNQGDLTFEPAGDAWRFNTVGVSHGLAMADLDEDGDLDAVVNNLNGSLGLYRNDSTAPRLAVRLKGRAPNTAGIGAKISLTGGRVTQSQEFISGGRYLASDDAVRVFAGWSGTNRFDLKVTWRSGNVTTITNLPANRIYEIDEASARPAAIARPTVNSPLFSDASAAIAHQHRDAAFDDFERQPLLSRRLSHGGPGITWADLDGDGREDLFIAGARGGDVGILRNLGGGKFARLRPFAGLSALPDDMTTILGWSAAAGTASFLVGQGNYETGNPDLPAATHFEIWAGGLDKKGALQPGLSSAGPMALADIDGDGDLDLFVGGRVNAGRYPEPADSRIYRNENGAFVLAQELKSIGLVTGAALTDLDQDGRPELVVACEWDSLKILKFSGNAFAEMDWGIGDKHGWWNGVASGDFDGDGRMDLIASNWGRNHPYQVSDHKGARIYYSDFTGAGRIDGVEAYWEKERLLPWRDFDALAKALPWLRGQFSSYEAFAQASLTNVLGGSLATARELRARWFDTTVFLNRGNRFEARALPIEAQFAPAFGICVADFNGDGNEDVFLAQNFFGTDGETSRYDAGRGLLLAGDGRGNFTSISGSESGLKIYGEQRGAAACDFDADGRVDLAVGQNNAETKLYRNENSPAGLRVRLRGAPGNTDAIGAVVRLARGTQRGPAREIQAGAGYWSQNSVVPVLHGEGDHVLVRWPGGRETRTPVTNGQREVVIDHRTDPAASR